MQLDTSTAVHSHYDDDVASTSLRLPAGLCPRLVQYNSPSLVSAIELFITEPFRVLASLSPIATGRG